MGNIGITLPILRNDDLYDMVYSLGHPECDIVLPSLPQPTIPESLPPYLVYPISDSEIPFLVPNEYHFLEGPINVKIMDFGNG